MGFGSWISTTFFGSGEAAKRETMIDVFEYYSRQIIVGCNNVRHISNAETNLLALKRHVETSIKDEKKRNRILNFLAAVGTTIGNIKEKADAHTPGIPYAFSREIKMDIHNAKQKAEIQADEYARGKSSKLNITSVSDNLAAAKKLFAQSL